MSIQTTLGIFAALLALYGLSLLVVDAPLLFLGRKFLDLLTWLAFWR